ncbi:DUF1272 domain-containing protein [candidate division KSB1 bacterium]|nr:DUF1272 domain-containing protein [candidate division KSB1 bacterium]
MALEMKSACEQCGKSLADGHLAFICTYECTFCPYGAAALEWRCPICRGELVRRPGRVPPAETALSATETAGALNSGVG